MSVHDYNIANQGFPAFRTDLNNALAAIVSNNSNATAPATTFAHMIWVDTSANPSVLKIRNADNDAWITIGALDQTNDTFILRPAAGSVSAPAYSTTGDTNTGIFFPAADTIAFAEGGAEAMRITSAGEVLVGGTTATTSGPGICVQSTFSGGGRLDLFKNDTTITSGEVLGVVHFLGNDTTSNTPTIHAYVAGVASGTHAAGDNPTDLVFGCTNDNSETVTEFARLGHSGASGRTFRVLQPTLTDGQVVWTGAAAGTAGSTNRLGLVGVYKHSGITNSAGFLDLYAEDGAENFIWVDNSDVLRISTNVNHIGTTSGTVVGAQTSDERIKNVIGPVTYGLEQINAIQPVEYTLKSEPDHKKIGFLAQQVLPLVPESVFDTGEHIEGEPEDAPTKLGMEYVALIPVLVNAVKELSAELNSVKAELATLKGQ
jgi:hypothetical protein